MRGLTTAASIWMTAAIGTLLGVGFYIPAAMATVITLFTLSVFRVLESKMPSRYFVRGTVRVRRNQMLPEPALRNILERHHFSTSTISYQLSGGGEVFEYHLPDPHHRPQAPAPAVRIITPGDVGAGVPAERDCQLSPRGESESGIGACGMPQPACAP